MQVPSKRLQPKHREPFEHKEEGQNRPRGVLLLMMADKTVEAEP